MRCGRASAGSPFACSAPDRFHPRRAGAERVVGLAAVGVQLRGRAERFGREVELPPLDEDVPEPFEAIGGFGVGLLRRERARRDDIRAAVGDEFDRLAKRRFRGGEVAGLLAQRREFAVHANGLLRALRERLAVGRELRRRDRLLEFASVEEQPREQRRGVVIGRVFVDDLACEANRFRVASQLRVELREFLAGRSRVRVGCGGCFELLRGSKEAFASEVPDGGTVARERVASRLGHPRRRRGFGRHAQHRTDDQPADHSVSHREESVRSSRDDSRDQPACQREAAASERDWVVGSGGR